MGIREEDEEGRRGSEWVQDMGQEGLDGAGLGREDVPRRTKDGKHEH